MRQWREKSEFRVAILPVIFIHRIPHTETERCCPYATHSARGMLLLPNASDLSAGN